MAKSFCRLWRVSEDWPCFQKSATSRAFELFCISGAFVYPATHDILSAHSLTSLFEELVVEALLWNSSGTSGKPTRNIWKAFFNLEFTVITFAVHEMKLGWIFWKQCLRGGRLSISDKCASCTDIGSNCIVAGPSFTGATSPRKSRILHTSHNNSQHFFSFSTWLLLAPSFTSEAVPDVPDSFSGHPDISGYRSTCRVWATEIDYWVLCLSIEPPEYCICVAITTYNSNFTTHCDCKSS